MPAPNTEPHHDEHSVSQDINWEDYRDHLATADKDGHRRWLYPKKPSGKWFRWRTWFSWVLIALMFLGPWIRINGNPLLMINIIERRFSILGQIFWPQDTVIFAVAMLVFITSIIIFTTAFGRLWCGWACPQTVYMEFLYRPIERLVEGTLGKGGAAVPARRQVDAVDDPDAPLLHPRLELGGLGLQRRRIGRFVRAGQFLVQPGDIELQAGQRLAEFVMEFPGDPAALDLFGFRQLARHFPQPLVRLLDRELRPFALADITKERAEHLPLTDRDGGDGQLDRKLVPLLVQSRQFDSPVQNMVFTGQQELPEPRHM